MNNNNNNKFSSILIISLTVKNYNLFGSLNNFLNQWKLLWVNRNKQFIKL